MAELDSSREQWASGITVKRTQSGYTWSVAVPASNPSEAAFMDAIELSKWVNTILEEEFGDKPGPPSPLGAEPPKKRYRR